MTVADNWPLDIYCIHVFVKWE